MFGSTILQSDSTTTLQTNDVFIEGKLPAKEEFWIVHPLLSPQSPTAALQNREDGLGGPSPAGHPPGKLHLRVRRRPLSLLRLRRENGVSESHLRLVYTQVRWRADF